jgi:phage/plasmid-like protein (TIGR03299 family)
MPANVDVYIGREPAWHNLGNVLGRYFNINDILIDGGLDFDVEKIQLYGLRPQFDQDGYIIDRTSTDDDSELCGRDFQKVSAWGVIRTDNGAFLGPVGERYEPIDHMEGFALLDHVIGQVNGAHYVTAGALGAGETVWGLIDMNLASGINGTEDVANNYLLFRTGHTGNFTFSLQGTRTRVVCQNTLMMALSEGRNVFTIKHTKNFSNRMNEAKVVIDQLRGKVKSVDEMMNHLATKVIERENMVNILDELFPVSDDATGERSTRSKNNIAKILELFEYNDGNAIPQIRGTAYNLLNACTEYVDHFRSVKGNTIRSRAESSMFGSGNVFKDLCVDVILRESSKMKSVFTPAQTTVSMMA